MRLRVTLSVLLLSCSSAVLAQIKTTTVGCSDRYGNRVACSPCALYGGSYCTGSGNAGTSANTNSAIIQGMSPAFQGMFNGIGQGLANMLFGNPAAKAAAEAEWREQMARQAEEARRRAEQRRRIEMDLHNRLMSELQLVGAQGQLQPMSLFDGAASHDSGMMRLDDDANLAPAGTSFFGLGGGKPALPADAPVVSMANLRRAAFLAQKAADAAPGDAAFLIDEAVNVANGKTPFIEIPDNAVPVVSEAGLLAFQQANIDYRRAHADTLAASQRFTEANRNRQIAEEVYRRVQEENRKAAQLTPERRRLAKEAQWALTRFQDETDRARQLFDQAQNWAAWADALRRFTLRSLPDGIDRNAWNSFTKSLQEKFTATSEMLDRLVGELKASNSEFQRRRVVQEGVFLGLTQGQEDVDRLLKEETSPFSGRSYADMHRSGEAMGLAFGIHRKDGAFLSELADPGQKEFYRGVADHLSLGRYTLNRQYVKSFLPALRGTEFNRLLAHSNGATMAEALIRADLIRVNELNILGGDRSLVNRESLQELISSGKVKKVVVWLNPGDPIPIISGTAPSRVLEKSRAAEASLVDALKGNALPASDAVVEYRYLFGKKFVGQELGLQAHDLRRSYLPNMRAELLR
jgi:hypothetical protein